MSWVGTKSSLSLVSYLNNPSRKASCSNFRWWEVFSAPLSLMWLSIIALFFFALFSFLNDMLIPRTDDLPYW